GQLASAVQRGFDGYVVDARGEDLAGVVIEQIGHRIVPSGKVLTHSAAECGTPIVGFNEARRAIERREMIMSDSWLSNVAQETEKTRLQGGFFCKRRLTRHDWNDGNNLAEVLLDEVHGPEVRSTQARKSIGVSVR
ncbi:hypothetical protein A249_28653, partial [Pseudomonas syringae pv. actinidiae ICMP 18804]